MMASRQLWLEEWVRSLAVVSLLDTPDTKYCAERSLKTAQRRYRSHQPADDHYSALFVAKVTF